MEHEIISKLFSAVLEALKISASECTDGIPPAPRAASSPPGGEGRTGEESTPRKTRYVGESWPCGSGMRGGPSVWILSKPQERTH